MKGWTVALACAGGSLSPTKCKEIQSYMPEVSLSTAFDKSSYEWLICKANDSVYVHVCGKSSSNALILHEKKN